MLIIASDPDLDIVSIEWAIYNETGLVEAGPEVTETSTQDSESMEYSFVQDKEISDDAEPGSYRITVQIMDSKGHLSRVFTTYAVVKTE